MFSLSTDFNNSGFRMPDRWIWCGSAVHDEKGYHLFASSWDKQYPMFDGYILHSEIVYAFSPTPGGPYRLVRKIFPAPGNSPIMMAHNPTVFRYIDGRYMLYFIASSYHSENPERLQESYCGIRIWMATAASPDGEWRLSGGPVLDVTPDGWDREIVTNPAPCIAPDGKIYLYYRSNLPGRLAIGLAVADRPEGPFRKITDGPVASDFNIEDPFVWHDGAFFRMIAKDMTGSLTGEVHAGAAFQSENGINWRFTGKAYSRTVSDMNFGALERPQLLFESGSPAWLFVAAADGPGGFRKAQNTWNMAFRITNMR